MPLSSVNYGGGIIVTDWYSNTSSSSDSIKISIRFLSNEIRSDALAIKVFYKNCSIDQSCKITDRSSALSIDLTKKINKILEEEIKNHIHSIQILFEQV